MPQIQPVLCRGRTCDPQGERDLGYPNGSTLIGRILKPHISLTMRTSLSSQKLIHSLSPLHRMPAMTPQQSGRLTHVLTGHSGRLLWIKKSAPSSKPVLGAQFPDPPTRTSSVQNGSFASNAKQTAPLTNTRCSLLPTDSRKSMASIISTPTHLSQKWLVSR